eukprot:5609493-Lingulodinium_polyedra.AAC.1
MVGLGSLVLDEELVQKVRAAKSIDAVMTEVRLLVDSGQLGRRLFGVYLGNSDNKAITNIVEQELKAWMTGE